MSKSFELKTLRPTPRHEVTRSAVNRFGGLVGVHVTQLSHYETGRSQPTLDVIRRLALALDVTADELIFDPSERMPQASNKELLKQWERIEGLPEEDRRALQALVEGLLLRRQIGSLRPPGL